VELHAVHSAGDALLAVSLAGTLFFAVPTDEARGRVALTLLCTLAPFALMAPVIGPFLDRFSQGRRWALGGSFAVRAFACWVLAGAVVTGDLSLYPAAFACLVASRAYTVTRAAVLPRLLPPSVSLVTANARTAAFGVLGASVAGLLGVALTRLGADWTLRVAFVVYAVGAVLSGLLDRRVDASGGEEDAEGLGVPPGPQWGRRRPRVAVGAAVVRALRANAALRALSGLLTMFLAFLLREQPLGGLGPELTVALAIGGVVVGSMIGTAAGALLRVRRPDAIVVGVLLGAAATTVLSAVVWTLATALLVCLVAGLAQQLGKLALDAVVQRDVPERVRTSAFARSETVLQLAWVVGGIVGIAMPLVAPLGLGVAAAGLAAAAVLVLRGPTAPVDAGVSGRGRRRQP
jgi:MFS family permease